MNKLSTSTPAPDPKCKKVVAQDIMDRATIATAKSNLSQTDVDDNSSEGEEQGQ